MAIRPVRLVMTPVNNCTVECAPSRFENNDLLPFSTFKYLTLETYKVTICCVEWLLIILISSTSKRQ